MTYIRPTNPTPIAPEDKPLLIQKYLTFYREIAQLAAEKGDYSPLNVKLPRSAAEGFLNAVGDLLLAAAKNSVSQPSEIKAFLAENSLPENLEGRLPEDFRAFCLLLNSLKQWVSVESAATDRWLLGGTVRAKLRSATGTCLVTAKALEKTELHHPIRDGRPPIPLSQAGHKLVETATEGNPNDPTMTMLRPLRAKGNRSWKALRDGCLSHMGDSIDTRTRNSLNSARSFSIKAQKATDKTCEELIEWLDENQLGL